MNFEHHKPAYGRNGYIVERQLLSTSEFQELNTNLDRYIREIVPHLPPTDAFYNDKSQPETLRQLHRMGQDAFFDTYRSHPVWKALAEGLIGEAREVPIHLQPGDIMAHHGNTIHLAGANCSATRHRRAFAMVFQGLSCVRDDEAFARYQTSAKCQQQSLGITE